MQTSDCIIAMPCQHELEPNIPSNGALITCLDDHGKNADVVATLAMSIMQCIASNSVLYIIEQPRQESC